MLRYFTVNILGNHIADAMLIGCHAYYANGITAIEMLGFSKKDAALRAHRAGWEVLYVFE